MTPKEKAIKQLENKVIIEHHDELSCLAIVHSGYGSPNSVDKYIVAELKKLNAMHLLDGTGQFLKDDIDDIRYNKYFIVAVIRAKEVVKVLDEKTSRNGRDKEEYYDSEDYDINNSLRYCDTNKKDLYIVDLNNRLVISEYDGMESVEGGGISISSSDLGNYLKIAEKEI